MEFDEQIKQLQENAPVGLIQRAATEKEILKRLGDLDNKTLIDLHLREREFQLNIQKIVNDLYLDIAKTIVEAIKEDKANEFLKDL